jgi:hypothetical protein
MEIIIILIIVVFIAASMNASAEAQRNKDALVREFKKVCPPHKWRYDEIKDHEGVTHAWRMACDHCGPLKQIDDGPRKMDY